MTTRTEAVEAMFGHLNTEWTANAPAPTPPIAVENINFDPPDDCDAWIRVAALHNEADLASLGGEGTRKWRTEGRLWVQIFTKLGIGRALSDSLMIVAINAFRGQTVGTPPVSVRMMDAKPQEVGPEGPWFMSTVSFRFMYDENQV